MFEDRSSQNAHSGEVHFWRKRRHFSSTSRTLFYSALVLSVAVFFANHVSPASFWIAGFVAPLAPLIFVGNVILAVYQLFRKSFRAVLVAIVLIIGWPILPKTYQYNSEHPIPGEQTMFRGLSYNVSFFSVPTVFTKEYKSPSYNIGVTGTLDWILQNDADIICLQEFFDDEESAIFNTVEALTSGSEYQYHFVYKEQPKNRTRRGLIILSKFPIINRGTVFISENQYNGAIYADVETPWGAVRVVNVHLESMRLGNLKSLASILRTYKEGVVTHARQSDQLAAFVRESRLPVVLYGDLNETPYSYAYYRLKLIMNNAFEVAGRGFGFTYDGERLFFLRIDHQFYTEELRAIQHATHSSVPFSKHFPIETSFTLATSNQ
ncbi:MAG: endonuclease/exonuclease/phosphatase family protein [Tunicatimonas sp.]